MSERSRRIWRGGGRAITGVLIIGVSVAVALALGTGVLPSPGVERGVVSVQVDTGRSSQFSLVCSGAFAELGADPTQPTKAIPGGESLLLVAGDPLETTELAREIPIGSPPLVLAGEAGAVLAAAELQLVQTPTLQGLVAASCAEPAHEQWLVGGGTAFGVSTVLVLGNPFGVPAMVEITVFDKDGRIDAQQTAGVLVPAGAQRTVSINGYAPAREHLAVRVTSTGAAVGASLGVSQTVDIRSYAVDMITRQLAPTNTLIFPAVTNALLDDHGPTAELAQHDEFPVVVRLLAPGERRGSAEIVALMPDGARQSLGVLEFEGERVAEFVVPHWPEQAQAVLVESSEPVVGGVFGSADMAPEHDYTWFAPAPLLSPEVEIPVAVVPGGELVLVNPGASEASVVITPEQGSSSTVTLPAGAAVSTRAQGVNLLLSSEPVVAGVRVVSGASIAAYPVLSGSGDATSITVFTR